MHRARRHLRPATWLALVAMLALALLPTLSRAMTGAGGGAWTEVCSAQGGLHITAAGDAGGSRTPAAHLLDHCPLCTLAAHAPLLSPGAPALPPPPAVQPAPPRAAPWWPPLRAAWRSAQPRGPPAAA